jgi:predicted O-linked N-acetylglucosamine transferase (SPINDLY family)
MSSLSVAQAFALAIGHHQAGRLAEAEALYRQILAVDPQHAEVWHMLGATALQSGRPDLAIQWIGQSLALSPQNPGAHSNLGEALRLSGRLDEAVASYRQALALKSDYPEAFSNLGLALAALGRLDEAIAAYDGALRLRPGYIDAHLHRGNALRNRGRIAEAVAAYQSLVEMQPGLAQAHNNLGVALAESGRTAEALAAYHRALGLQPGCAEFHNNLANALTASGRFDDAIAAYHRALELHPAYPEAHSNLGNVLREQGRFAEAIASYRRALEFAPNIAGIHNNLANALRDLGQRADAIAAYRRALELQPGLIEARSNLGAVLAEQGALDEAHDTLCRAIELHPGYAEAHNSLGNVLMDLGRLDEALAAYRQARALKPDEAKYQSNIILVRLCHPDQDRDKLTAALRRWNEDFGAPLAPAVRSLPHQRVPGRRLRIGYVSSSFFAHVVGRNLLPLFRHHDHRDFEIVGYSDVAKPDALTAEFERGADRWRSVFGFTDEALSAMIREDQVDVLVDLGQHTRGNRLPVFARRPAPVQVSFAGYPENAGIDAIPCRLSDRWMEAEGRMQDAGFRMQDEPASCLYLLDSFWCYDSCGVAVPVGDLPSGESGAVTFGSLNNFCKINEPLLELWARILRQTAGSRLLLICPPGSARERVTSVLSRHGVNSERVEFTAWRPRREYLELYQRVDIVLDPFPYGGHTTSLDALWMGTPVVSLAGDPPVSRAGLSILSNLGLPELVAFTVDDYVRTAGDLARDRARLAELRRTLRPRMETSVLMDGLHFARGIEAAYRAMWRHWGQETPA